jgi:hypothetical protein
VSSHRVYQLYLPRVLKVVVFGVLTFFVVMGIMFLTGSFPSTKGPPPPRFIGFIWLAILAWNGYWVFSIPQRILVSETGTMEFQSVLRRWVVTPVEIESIKPQNSHVGFLTVRTARGKIRLLNQFDDFHEFLWNLKQMNPSVELRGC